MGPEEFDKAVEKRRLSSESRKQEIIKEYNNLKSLHIKSLQDEFKKYYKISTPEGNSKSVLIMGILEAKYSASDINDAFKK